MSSVWMKHGVQLQPDGCMPDKLTDCDARLLYMVVLVGVMEWFCRTREGSNGCMAALASHMGVNR